MYFVSYVNQMISIKLLREITYTPGSGYAKLYKASHCSLVDRSVSFRVQTSTHTGPQVCNGVSFMLRPCQPKLYLVYWCILSCALNVNPGWTFHIQ